MIPKLSCLLILINSLIVCSVPRIDHDIPKFKRGPTELVDEVALTNPESFDYDFSDDLSKPVDKQDLYDQFIDQLPMFHIYKLGQDRGVTEVPIVTRAWDTWFTPTTPAGKEQKFTWWSTTLKPKTTTTTEMITTTPTPTTTTQSVSTTTPILEIKITKSFRRPFAFKQPPPVFRQDISTTSETPIIDHGPVWRSGGALTLPTTTRRPTTPRTWTRRQFFTQTTTQPPTTTTPTTTTATVPRFVTVMGTRWVAGPRQQQQQSLNQNWRQPIKPIQTTFQHPVPPTHLDPISRSLPKPVVIQNPKIGRYSGPTYNCRVLNPYTDGEPSTEHDPSCQMLYPGLSLDGSCRCFYKVAGRDTHGCATGFVYACRSVGLHSISV